MDRGVQLLWFVAGLPYRAPARSWTQHGRAFFLAPPSSNSQGAGFHPVDADLREPIFGVKRLGLRGEFSQGASPGHSTTWAYKQTMKKAVKRIAPFDPDKECLNVVVETPKGSRVKYAFNLES